MAVAEAVAEDTIPPHPEAVRASKVAVKARRAAMQTAQSVRPWIKQLPRASAGPLAGAAPAGHPSTGAGYSSYSNPSLSWTRYSLISPSSTWAVDCTTST